MSVKKAIAAATLAIIVFAGIFSSCKKEIDNPTGSTLVFSTDTVQFDTIFTTLGSTTKAFKVYNPTSKTLKIDEIKLAGGTASQFRLNIDGVAGTQVTNIELAGGDSLFIFVEVTVDPGNVNTPFVIADSVVFTAGSSVQDVKLVAWGQDAYYYYPTAVSDTGLPAYSLLDCNDNTWTNDKPHIIFGSLIVQPGCTLTIEAGAQVRFYKNSNLVIANGGTLIVNGLPDQKVYFGGTRLEQYLEDAPGQWGTYYQGFQNGQVYRFTVGGIWFTRGSNGNINHAIIKNSYTGIQADSSLLVLTNTEIYNHNSIGLYAQSSTITGYNNVIGNCANYAVALALGGNYNFRHCTFANYWSGNVRQTPTLLLNNYYDNGTINSYPFNAYFGNSIIYGNIDNEIGFDFVANPTPGLQFEKCLIKIDPDFDTSNSGVFTSIIKNPFPALDFKSTFDNDYRLDTLTVAQDAGDANITNTAPAIVTDNTGTVNRIIGSAPDMGAFEREY